MTKWCGDFWGLEEVMVRRCSALLVLGLGEDEGLWVGIFFGDSFLESTRSTRSSSDFLRVGIFWAIAFLGALGATRSTRTLRVGIFWGSTRSSSEHSDFEDGDFLGLFLIGSVGFSGLGHLFSDAALL